MAILAMTAACLHVLGYAAYIAFVRRGHIAANPLSWLMFAYGTGLLTFLEYRAGATWPELLLPLVCSTASVVVAALCIRAIKLQALPAGDIAAFIADIALTALYVALWLAEERGLLGNATSQTAVMALLISANLTTLIAFLPILRSTFTDPQHERAMPWLLWTAAYALLFAATLPDATSHQRLSLLVYPAINVALHLVTALLAISRWWRTSKRELFEVKETGKTGLGLFATRSYQRGDHVFRLTGPVRRWKSRTQEDAKQNENWFGIGKDRWIEPNLPYVFVNHSCDPNLGIDGERDFVALREICIGEELTFDYSISEDETDWSMECLCGSSHCRGKVGPVNTLPQGTLVAYLPYVGSYFHKRYRSAFLESTPRRLL